ncbi:hypothetical protein HED55_01295 [Ochrobactrum haematophilum]|uniref:Uncharacterized protein n=1 Tax=Brucella haematophila TaxID=419474 RepID=A0ABX1DIE2_9HYPH|nr:hypothetical protein [Brucella haematophila]
MLHSNQVPVQSVEVVAPNFKQRLSGVTSTIVQLIPLQRAKGLNIATMGPGLPDSLPHLGWGALLSFWSAPKSGASGSGMRGAILKCSPVFSCVMFCV